MFKIAQEIYGWSGNVSSPSRPLFLTCILPSPTVLQWQTPQICVCSCVSLKTVIPFCIWVLKFVLVSVAKLENWRWGGRVGGSRSEVYPGNWLSLLDPGNVHISMLSSNPKPIVLGRTFLMFVFSCKPCSSHLLGLTGKIDGWHVFLSVQRQDANVYSLSAGCFTSEEMKNGIRKLFFKVADLAG